MPTKYDCATKAATTTQHNNTRPTEKMPLDVLARTCESFPQLAHEAGEERLDQRTAMPDTAAALHQGHLCIRFNVKAARHVARSAQRLPAAACPRRANCYVSSRPRACALGSRKRRPSNRLRPAEMRNTRRPHRHAQACAQPLPDPISFESPCAP